MKIIGIIPARMGSSRFPGKPLANINGLPMIGHVYFRSKMSSLLDEVFVATCDQEIADYMKSINGKYIMTSHSHERASDRTAEALLKIEQEIGKKMEIVVMIQGDEPMITPAMVNKSIEAMQRDPSIKVLNLMAKMNTREEHKDPNEVKVVVNLKDEAIYFSREPIPSWKKGGKNIPMLKQVCIIPFQRDFLFKFNELEQTPLEIIESVDMLRVIENSEKVKMIRIDEETFSVDTQVDLAKVDKLMKNDPLQRHYEGKIG
jgi:3-deoxy-manno-octulosonate cytidylyltransferase (CMP-KDO synthetase)